MTDMLTAASPPEVAAEAPPGRRLDRPDRVRRVLLLNYESPPAAGGGGYATVNIARQLAEMGVAVDVLTARIEGAPADPPVPGLRTIRVPSWRKSLHDCGLVGAYSYVGFAAATRRRLLRERSYDLEHFFFALPTGALSLAPGGVPPRPYIVSLRGSDVPGYDPFNTKVETLHRVLGPATRRIWGRAAAVVALSRDLAAIARRTMPDLPFEVIPNGIDLDRFRPPEARPNGDGPLRLISVARLLERKGLHHLLEAIARPAPLPVRLTIAGTGPYEAALRQQALELGLAERVTFAGFVDNDSLAVAYREADLFVLPSQTESFGLVFAEAMASGLPILATRVGGIPELVRHGQDGLLVAPAAPDALRGALARLIANPGERRAMGRSARARVVESYGWRSVAERYLALYERILADRAAMAG